MKPILRVGRYTVFGAIGSGGMATVHLGRLRGAGGFGRTVAIKRLHASFAGSEAFAARFVAEAKLASRVQHPNVVATIDALASDGELLLVMDHVLGESLQQLLAQGALPPAVAVAVAIDVLRGLHAAHEAVDEQGARLDLVHRDVSPHNVMIGVDGVARLLDFGIATITGDPDLTHGDEAVEGKAAYMAPEQLFGEPLDRRSDVYAVGVVLWECLTGARLFGAGGGQSTATRVLEERVDRPSVRSDDLPVGLDAIVMRALSRDATSRYPDAAAMERALLAAMPPAPPAAVADLLEVRCAEALAKRRALVGEVEGATQRDDHKRERVPQRARWVAAALALVAGAVWLALPDDAAVADMPMRASASAMVPITAEASSRPARAATARAVSPPRSAAPLPAASPPPRPSPTTEQAADPCDPPFVLDERGHKRYRRGCFP